MSDMRARQAPYQWQPPDASDWAAAGRGSGTNNTPMGRPEHVYSEKDKYWSVHEDDDQEDAVYFYNSKTKESTWVRLPKEITRSLTQRPCSLPHTLHRDNISSGDPISCRCSRRG